MEADPEQNNAAQSSVALIRGKAAAPTGARHTGFL
jgi:hypothetical protein